jgi:hypothetical protein
MSGASLLGAALVDSAPAMREMGGIPGAQKSSSDATGVALHHAVPALPRDMARYLLSLMHPC